MTPFSTNFAKGAKFWMSVLTDIKNRGVEDILIACMDSLTVKEFIYYE